MNLFVYSKFLILSHILMKYVSPEIKFSNLLSFCDSNKLNKNFWPGYHLLVVYLCIQEFVNTSLSTLLIVYEFGAKVAKSV